MQAISLSFFHFPPLARRLRATLGYPLAWWSLRRLSGAGFTRVLGAGTRGGFDPRPDFALFAFLATWPSLGRARAAVSDAPVYRRWRSLARESCTLYLTATRTIGAWGGEPPFRVPRRPENARETDARAPCAVLTRSALRGRALLPFWRRVPVISGGLDGRAGLLFHAGLSVLPILQQATFTVWEDLATMNAFARSEDHAEAARRARRDGWFREELFTRFQVLGAEGTWAGRPPLPPGLAATRA